MASTWIDLSSEDPAIANLSQQVLNQEVAYAAFCGANNVVVQGPKPHTSDAGLTRYANGIREVLSLGIYLNIVISVPMAENQDGDEDVGDLANFAREDFSRAEAATETPENIYSSWDAWHIVRSVCKYSTKLFVGKKSIHFPNSPCQSFTVLGSESSSKVKTCDIVMKSARYGLPKHLSANPS